MPDLTENWPPAGTPEFRQFVEQSPQAAVIINGDRVVVFANRACESLFERPARQLLGRPIVFPLDGTPIPIQRSSGPTRLVPACLETTWEGRPARVIWFTVQGQPPADPRPVQFPPLQEVPLGGDRFKTAEMPAPEPLTRLRLLEDELASREREIKVAEAHARTLERRLMETEQSVLEAQREAVRAAEKAVRLERELLEVKDAAAQAQRALDLEQQVLELRAQLEVAQQEAGRLAGQYDARLQQLTRESADFETQRMAYEDSLTGLPNLNIIRQFVGMTLKRALGGRGAAGLMYLDLDRFRVVNDSLGHKAGDQLLRQVAEQLKALVTPEEALGRRGEDEFLIVIYSEAYEGGKPPMANVSNRAKLLASQIFRALASSITVEDQIVHLSASIGATLYPDVASTGEEMLAQAEAAMRRAKELGRGRLEFHTPELKRELKNRQDLMNQLRSAVVHGNEFLLHYQPIIDLKKGRMVGAEALLRWRHPLRGLLEPAKFLAVAEETGLIVPIGEWVIRQACLEIQRSRKLFLSINMSPWQLMHVDFFDNLVAILNETRVKPQHLVFEVPETISVDVDRARDVLKRLEELGVGLAVENFGSGYTSLNSLKDSRVRFLKIDRAFVEGLPRDRKHAAICTSIVGLAASLEALCLAQGVEDQNQARFLAKTGCHLAQGHYFAPAVTSEDLAHYERQTWTL